MCCGIKDKKITFTIYTHGFGCKVQSYNFYI